MIPSPLIIETHFFSKIQIEASAINADNAGEGVLSSHLECRKHKDAENRFLMQLGVKLTADKDKGTPLYTFEVEAVGIFTVRDAVPKDQVKKLVTANGAAMLYGAIREMVANLTARGPHIEFNLPTVTFIDDAEKANSHKEVAAKTKKQVKAHK